MSPLDRAVVSFVAAGPGDPGLLTVRAAQLLDRADVVLADAATAETMPTARHARVELVEAGGPRVPEIVADEVALGRTVVRLLPGDGRVPWLGSELLACRALGVGIELVPGVSAAVAVPAYAGVPLVEAAGQSVWLLDASCAVDVAATDATMVMTGSASQLADAFTRLLCAGRDADTAVLLAVRGTTMRQRSTVTTLGEHDAGLRALGVAGGPGAPVAAGSEDLLAVVGGNVELRTEVSWFETRALFGYHVLVPSTHQDVPALVARLQDHGATAEVVPTVTVAPPRTPAQLDRAIRGMVTGTFEWVAFTARGAVRAVREKLTELGLDARALSGLRIAAVAGEAAEALRSWGIEPDLLPSEPGVQALLDAWPEYDPDLDPIAGVLLPRAEIATETLAEGLDRLGWVAEEVTAYRTIRADPPSADVRERIKHGRFDAVVFSSSACVRNLVGIAGKPHRRTIIACIGPATARTAAEHGLRVDVVADAPSELALVDALARFVAGRVVDPAARADHLVRG